MGGDATESTVRPGREVGTDLLELLALLRRALQERGEGLPATWPEDAYGEVQSGRMSAWVVDGGADRRGVAILSLRGDRGFGHLHLTKGARPREEGSPLVLALLKERPPGLRRFDVTLSAATPEAEAAWADLLVPPRFPFQRIDRRGLVRDLSVPTPPTELPLPSGFETVSAVPLGSKTLSEVDFLAFSAGPDAGLVAETPAENERLLEGLLEGDLGAPVGAASVAAVQVDPTSQGSRGRLAGFVLALEESPRRALIADVAVGPAYRRRGLARALITRSLRALTALGFSEVRLWVTDANLAARTLYEGLGFRVERRGRILRWEEPSRAPPAAPHP